MVCVWRIGLVNTGRKAEAAGRGVGFAPLLHGGEQGADTDAGRAEGRALIDFDERMQLSGAGEEFRHLIGGDGVEAASERGQLHQFEVGARAHQRRGPVQTGMIGPLVHDPERFGGMPEVRHTVLAEHGGAEGGDEFGQTVMDRRIGMVRPPGQHDAELAGAFQFGEHPFAFGPEFGAVGFLFEGGDAYGCAELLFRDAEQVMQRGNERVGMFQRHERRVQGAVLFQQFVRIQADDFRVPGHHRTVVAVRGVFALPALARQAGEKDALEPLAQERGDVPVRELGGVADRLRGHGRQAEIEKLLVRRRGQLHAVAQFREQREPERVMLVHIEHAGDADAPARGVVLRERFVSEQAAFLPCVQVGHGRAGRFAAGSAAFAAVAGHEFPAVGKAVDREQAVVAASLAAQGFGGNIEGAQGSRRQGRGGRAVGRAAAGEQGRAVGPHEPGDVGAAHMMVKEPFHDPQQGIVQKRAPLHQHAVPKFGGRAQAQDFVQRVAGHGVAQPGGDVADVRAFLLRLFDLGIHEHGTARSQIHGMPGEQGGAHERLHAQVEAAGECFEEGPASGGAGFVEGHARDEAVPRLEALHILAADVDDVRRIGHEAAGGLQVGHRFHVGGQRAEGGLRELRAVARGYAGLDPRAFGQAVDEIGKVRQEPRQRIALIAFIP